MHPLTQTWWRLLINRTDGTIRRGRDGWVFTPREVTVDEMDAALAWRQSLGVYATGMDGLCRWVCLDADTPAGLDVLVEVAAGLDPSSTLFEVSRRGGHLWWFCPPTPWHQARSVGQALVAAHADIEVFPRGPGRNGVRVPRTRHPDSNQVYPIVDPATGAVREVDDLCRLRVAPLPQRMMALPAAGPCSGPHDNGTFDVLLREVERVTSVRVYGPERAIGHCPFHDDHRPSLSLLGGFWRCWAGCGEGGVNAFRAKVKHAGKGGD